MKILVMGLPGSGKTTFAKKLSKRLAAVHFNADEVRGTINKHLGFSETDRLQQAFTMGWMCDQVGKAGAVAVADFVCPTPMTRQMFGADALVVFMDTIKAGRFADTNRVFVPATSPDFIVTDWSQSPDIIDRIAKL
jgi:adenylylsulfate kinase